jgi:hypothetical protein
MEVAFRNVLGLFGSKIVNGAKIYFGSKLLKS